MKPRTIIFPIENQVRELDAKLLLACVAVSSGFDAIIGWRGIVDSRIGRFPPSVYVAKSMSKQNRKILDINRQLGHTTIAWDEEALVHYPREIYYARRIGAQTLELIDLFIAWGQDNEKLLRNHPNFDNGDIRVLGNPRIDLLRNDMSAYFESETQRISDHYGSFILVNTNFGSINAFADSLNLVRSSTRAWTSNSLGRGSIGMPEAYARGLAKFRSEIFKHFLLAIPAIAKAFPERNIVIRPHPSENHSVWSDAVKTVRNVHVVADGNVIPWLKASKCLIHNGCTTAVEAALIESPVVAYRPIADRRYDFELPNRLSVNASNCAALIRTIRQLLDASSGSQTQAANARTLATYIAPIDKTLISQKIIDAIKRKELKPKPSGHTRAIGQFRAEVRALSKRVQRYAGIARYSRGFVAQRFPDITTDSVQTKINRLAKLSGIDAELRVSEFERNLFRVSCRGAA